MPITIGAPQQTRYPSVKLAHVGAHVVVALVDVDVVPWTDINSGQPKLGKDGRPRTQEVVTALVISGEGANVPDGDNLRPVQPGEVVSIWLPGHKRYEWIQAQKAMPKDYQLCAGDVLKWTYERDEAPSRAGNNPKKVHTCKLRRAKPEEAEQVRRCEELYADKHAETGQPIGAGPFDGGSEPVYGGDGFDDDEF